MYIFGPAQRKEYPCSESRPRCPPRQRGSQGQLLLGAQIRKPIGLDSLGRRSRRLDPDVEARASDQKGARGYAIVVS
jgi:hypothetical protein